MSEDKFRTFIHTSRIMLWLITIVVTIVWIKLLNKLIDIPYDDESNAEIIIIMMLYVLACAWIIFVSFAIASFFLKLNEFRTKSHRYVLYLGWHKDVLMCDGIVVDMFKGMSFSAVNLEYDDGKDEKVVVRISPFFNSSTIKVNGRVLY